LILKAQKSYQLCGLSINKNMPNLKKFNYCREEYNKWQREYRAKNREKLREYNREYNKNWRKEYGYKNEESYKERYPQKVHAHNLLSDAIRTGKMIRKDCEVCQKPNAQGHHEDYDKPLEVIWLCPLHHTQLHLSKKLSTDN